MLELLVVADDLTGATDTAVHFGKRGIPVAVVKDTGAPYRAPGARVLVVDVASRHLAPDEAALRVEDAVRRGREAGITRFFKKTDSTLRGNVGAEIAALLRASGHARLAFVPALPALGRTTRRGVQYVHGHPLHETEFARDPLDPVREGSVAAIVARQAPETVASLGAGATDPASGDPLPEARILILDADTDVDLGRIVAWLAARDLLGAVAGTAALASALAQREDGPGVTAPLPRSGGRMLVLGGSLSPVSRDQLDHAAANGFSVVPLPPEAAVDGAGSAAFEGCLGDTCARLAAGEDVILRASTSPADVAACLALGEKRGLDSREVHLRVALNAGELARGILGRVPVGIVMVLGGDTLDGVIRALGQPTLYPCWEALPGIPVSRVRGHEGLSLVSKAGGFGSVDAITRVRDVMNREVDG